MCGIVGIFSNKKSVLNQINSMNETLIHRGPNNGNNWIDYDYGISFGFRRLSILDLSQNGDQPMFSKNRNFTIIFNGEIYNHLDLKKQLLQKNITFKGTSDTEILIEYINYFGIKNALKDIKGMFAFALWDNKNKLLYLCRDRMGEKPLYYGWSKGSFVFASELKAIKKFKDFDGQISNESLSLYMQYSYIPSPYSIYKNIHKLQAGCLLCIDIDNTISPPFNKIFAPLKKNNFEVNKYWNLSEFTKKDSSNLFDLKKNKLELKKLLLQSVESQLISDVPVGAFLSGGIDSSIIVSLMKEHTENVNTFTVGFNYKDYDESSIARLISKHLNTNHFELKVNSKDCIDTIPELQNIYCEPFADSSQIPTYLISKFSKQRVTVSLTGDGGDELFGGYNRYLWIQNISPLFKYLPFNIRKIIALLIIFFPQSFYKFVGINIFNLDKDYHFDKKLIKFANKLKDINSVKGIYNSLVSTGSKDILNHPGLINLESILEKYKIEESIGEESRFMYYDQLTYLSDDILCKVDRASMANSLETRAPFLDRDVIEFSWTLPLENKINKGNSKFILKEILKDYLPENIINLPKKGFSIPLNEWLRGPLRDWVELLIHKNNVQENQIFNSNYINRIWKDHLKGNNNHDNLLWNILMYQSWILKS